VVVQRGPVIYSLGIATDWKKLKTRGMTADWEAYPKSEWNYGLQINEKSAASVKEIQRPETNKGVFTAEGAPVYIEVKAKKIPAWKGVDGWAEEVPQSPVASGETVETLQLMPYGAAKLRITAFPEVKDSSGSG
jgi:uncharacterized protein